ncbi:hypothetical protein ASF49_19835 [Methylobacterium sp. Leaf104]|nr:hypothetical protein ASF49_19835 [Methylobacterium sp. Leaf104]
MLVASVIVALSCTVARADELNDLPDLACAQASSAVERAQIGCPDANHATAEPRGGRPASPLDRAEDD